jgi:hypothetical protein
MFISAPLKAAFEDSISSGKFIDTKFWVPNRLNRETGQLEQPKAVFANSTVVRSIPYLSARKFSSIVSVRMCLTVLDSVLDSVPEGRLDGSFPQTTGEPPFGEYEYQSDADFSNGIPQGPPPIPSSTPEQDWIAEGPGLL